MSDTVIRVENISKLYRLGEVGTGTLSHDLNRWWHRIRGKEDPYLKIGQTNDRTVEGDSEYAWALKDINFEVKRGEVLGIIGRNGAGKSTLLKILSRVTTPTSGEIKIKGRVASLLEVGTGFNPELTGRDNIYLNGAIMGMRRQEITRKFDEIVAFSGVERYIDTPVKRYSSGMYVRLAFAVAAHLEPEILIVDEVLAVGDAEFQKKCLGKMQDVAGHGRTILFVSHNMVAVQSLCRRGLLLREGTLIADDAVAPVISSYLSFYNGRDEIRQWDDPQTAPGNEMLRIKSIQLVSESVENSSLISMQTPFRIETEYWALNTSRQLHIAYHLLNDQGVVVLTSGLPARTYQAGLHRAVCQMPGGLLNSGGYSLKLLVVENGNKVTYTHENLASFTVVDIAERKGSWLGREPGVVQPVLPWRIETVRN
jgi:lipopolysaccharide transport system ATP-binding protein